MKILMVRKPELEVPWPDDVEVVHFNETKHIPLAHRDADAVVLWGMRGKVQEIVDQLPHARWYQSLSTGADALRACKFNDDVVVTNGVHLHDRPVAEHALALALYLTRRLDLAAISQHNHKWNTNLSAFGPLHDGKRVTTLVDANVMVWGFGGIGQQIARDFEMVGAHVIAVARSAGNRADFPVITNEQMKEYLPKTDVLVMALPATAETKDLLDAEVLEQLPDRALIVNVGRGTSVDEAALLAALKEGRIGGAALDVFKDEPLPEDSPLWDAPNLLITPHAAGGRPDGAVERLLHNYKAWVDNDIDRMIGVVRRPLQ